MTNTKSEKTIIESVPFQEGCNTRHFFTGGGREAILNDIKMAFNDKVELITLIGEEGSGKTMLCTMLKEQWNTQSKVIYLPHVIESFEDIVRVVAQECDVLYPVDATRADAQRILLDLIASIHAQGNSLVFLCDEAEKMYLATLERMRKIIDEVNDQGGGVQVLLAGRKSLAASLEQLHLCDFKQIHEKQFFLSALDDNETWNYLNFIVQSHRGTEQQEVFTREATAKIASMSRGNLRMINMHADESLQSSDADTSFLVLFDHVKDDESDTALHSPGTGFLSGIPNVVKYGVGGVVIAGILLLFFLFTPNEELPVANSETKQDNTPVIVVTEPIPEKVVETVTEIIPSVVEEVLEPNSPQDEAENKEEISGAIVEISPVELVEEPVVASPSLESAEPPTPVETKPELSDLEKDPTLGRFFVKGRKWFNGEMESEFSIQLMVLQSDNAVKNLKQMTMQPNYQAVVDKLVMLEKPSSPPVILVFYGVYPSMAAARSARNNMPLFLRDRHPYPISVRGAVEKARVE